MKAKELNTNTASTTNTKMAVDTKINTQKFENK